MLASSVAGAFDCKYFHNVHWNKATIVFVGVDVDHEVANFTFGYVYRTINKLAAEFMAKYQQKRLSVKGKRKARASFCLGAAQVVGWKLGEQKAVTPITTTALVPVKQALIEAKMGEFGCSTHKIEDVDISDRAFWSGRAAGAGIDHKRKAMPKKGPKLVAIGR